MDLGTSQNICVNANTSNTIFRKRNINDNDWHYFNVTTFSLFVTIRSIITTRNDETNTRRLSNKMKENTTAKNYKKFSYRRWSLHFFYFSMFVLFIVAAVSSILCHKTNVLISKFLTQSSFRVRTFFMTDDLEFGDESILPVRSCMTSFHYI